jgi:hypothetical protein
LALNKFEISVLRILAKKHNPMRISSLIEGFPDYYIDNILLALLNLSYQGYIMFSDHNNSPEVRIFLNNDRRKEVLKIIDPLPSPRSIAEANILTDPERAKNTNNNDNNNFYYQNSNSKNSLNNYSNTKDKKSIYRFLEPIKNKLLSDNNQQDYTSGKNKTSNVQPLILKSLATLSLIVLGFMMSTLSVVEFVGDNNNYSSNVVSDRNVLKFGKHAEKPFKYQWHLNKEYFRDTNSSSSSSFIAPSDIQQASYLCSREKNYSY